MIRLSSLPALAVALLFLTITIPAELARRCYVAVETEFDRWGGMMRLRESAAWAWALLLCLLAETADRDDEVSS